MSIGCQPRGRSGGKSSFHAPAIVNKVLTALAVPRLGGSAGDVRPSFGGQFRGTRESPFESPQATEFNRCWIFLRSLRLLVVLPFSRRDIDNQLCKLVG